MRDISLSEGGAVAPLGATSATASDVMIAARLDRLPMTGYQKMIFSITATAWLFDSVDLGSLTFLLGSIKSEFNLSTTQTGFLSSMSFLGMFLGAALSGMLADKIGRKLVFQVSMIFWGAGSLWCYFAPDPTTLGYARLLLGFGMGMEFPVALAIVSEIVPTENRGRYLAILEGFWPIGFIAAGMMSWFFLSNFRWREMFLAQAVPALFLFVVRFLVPESPRWLADQGRQDEAERVMSEIEAKVIDRLPAGTRLDDPRPLAAFARGERRFSFMELWRGEYASRTVMIWLTWFFALLGFYGLTTWLGALLQSQGYAVTTSVEYIVLIALAGVPGFITAAWLIEAWGRKGACALMLIGSALTAFAYGNAPNFTMLIVFGLAMQFFLFGMWSTLYAYTPELYPTRARATGTGCASAVGRIGSLIGPSIIGVVLPSLGSTGVFALGAGSFLIAALAVLTLGIETRGRALEEISG